MSVPPSDQTLNNAKIRIITNSDIRYEGTLYKINPDEKTITLRNVQSFGTEDRRADKVQPASALIYEYIVFRSIEIKDLIVLKEENIQAEKTTDDKKDEKKNTPQETKSVTTPVPPKTGTKVNQPQKKGETTLKTNVNKPVELKAEETIQNHPVQKSSGVFQFDKMVESLSEFERNKTEKSKKYESKYENDDFFDTISSSVASDKKREIESYNDKRMDRDTFGHVSRIHFTTDYHRNFDKNRPSNGQGNQGGYRPRNDQRGDNRNDYRNEGRYEPQRYESRSDGPHGNFRKKTGENKPRFRREEEEYVYVKKEN